MVSEHKWIDLPLIEEKKILHFNRRGKGIIVTDTDRVECRFGDGQMREFSFDGFDFSLTYGKRSLAEAYWDKWEGEKGQGHFTEWESGIQTALRAHTRFETMNIQWKPYIQFWGFSSAAFSYWDAGMENAYGWVH